MKKEAGSRDLWGLSFEVQKLLMNKSVIILGDSNQRGVYKDLVLLLQKNDILSASELRRKGELSFRNDCLLRGGVKGMLSNEVTYLEEREYCSEHHQVRFYFITRCYNSYVEAILQGMAEGRPPDLVIMNSCLWDLTRYGTNALSSYRDRMVTLCSQLVALLPPGTQFLWTTTLPIAKQARGGVLTPEVRLRSRRLTLEVMEGNSAARSIVGGQGLRYLDLEAWLHNKLHLRGSDGVHWCGQAHRYISELLLTVVSHLWGERLLPLACLLSYAFVMPRGPSMGGRSMVEEDMEQYGHVPCHTMATPYRRPVPYHVPVPRPLFQPGCGQMSSHFSGGFSRRGDRIPPSMSPWWGDGIPHSVNNGFNNNWCVQQQPNYWCVNQQPEILDDSGFVNDDFGPYWWEEQDWCVKASYSSPQTSERCTSLLDPPAHSPPGRVAPASLPPLSQAAPACLPAVHQGSASSDAPSCSTPDVVTVKEEPLSSSEESPAAVSPLWVQTGSCEVLLSTIKSEPLSPCQQPPGLQWGSSGSAPASLPASASWSWGHTTPASHLSAETSVAQSSSQMTPSSQSVIQTSSSSKQLRQTPVSQSLRYQSSSSTTAGLRCDSSQSKAGNCNQPPLAALRNIKQEHLTSENLGNSNQPSRPALRNVKQEQSTRKHKSHTDRPLLTALRNIKEENFATKGVANRASLPEGGKSKQGKFTSANWQPCDQACPPCIKQEGFAGFTLPEHPAPALFLRSWADYSQDPYVGALRRPFIAGRCANPAHHN